MIRSFSAKLTEFDIILKPSKCSFAASKIHFLGHIVSKDGIEADPEKVKAIKEFPKPQKIKDVQSFVGVASYYRKFIKDFSSIAEPLTRLTKKDVSFHWGEEQELSFNSLKDLLANSPLLVHFRNDPKTPTKLRTDASGYGIGAVLLQDHGNGYQPVYYLSRLMTQHEKNYTVRKSA